MKPEISDNRQAAALTSDMGQKESLLSLCGTSDCTVSKIQNVCNRLSLCGTSDLFGDPPQGGAADRQLLRDHVVVVLENALQDIYAEIKETLLISRNQAYSAVNFAMVQAYWHIGRIIVEHEQNGSLRAEYGKAVLQGLSERLTEEFGKGFDVRNLRNMRAFYRAFPKWNAVRSELTWTHYRALLRVEDDAARRWYMEECIKSGWSSRQLERQISTLYYDRLLASRDKSPVIAEAGELIEPLSAENFIKDPYVLDFLDLKNYPALRESDLEQALIDKLQEFLLELGRGFCFVARQKLMRYEDEDFYLDLVFYHSILKCHVLIDLKIGKLTHGDAGQMDSYIRMFDALYKNDDDNPTIGIILCSQKNEAIVKYSVLNDAKQVFASKYRLTLPSAEELQRQIEEERRRIEEQVDVGN